VAPKPGAHPVKQVVIMEPTAGEQGLFVHDEGIAQRFSVIASKRLHPFEEKVNNDPQDYDNYESRLYRMVCFLMARKLSVSMSDEQNMHHGGNLRTIATMVNRAPSGFIPFIDHFGTIDNGEIKFSMAGQPLLAFSYFCRAVIDNMPQRESQLTINVHWPRAKRMLFEYALSVVHAWAENAPHHTFVFAGPVNVAMSVPKPGTGIRGYQVFVQAVPKTAFVMRMLEIAALIEPFINVQLNDATTNALAAQNVVIVDWNSSEITSHGANYETNVETRLRLSMSTSINWVQVNVFKTTGSESQLLVKATEHMFYCGYKLSGEALTLGWMAAASVGLTIPNQKAFHMLPKSTSASGMTTYVEQMIKD